MQILAIGDPHFKVDTLFDSEQYILKVESAIKSVGKLDSIVVLGDVLHTHEKIYTFAMNMAVRFLKMCSSFAPTYVMVGNHDATSNTIFCGDNHWMNVLKFLDNITVVDKPTWIEHTKCLCVPYVTDGRFVECLETFCGETEEEDEDEENSNSFGNLSKVGSPSANRFGWKKADIIFAHQLFNGAKMGAIVATDVEDWHVKWPTIISGHIHDKQTPQPNLIYIGSSQQHAFGESEDKSLCLIRFSEHGNFQLEDVYLDLKKKKIVYTSISELASLKLKENVTYKIVLEDDDAKLKAFKKTAQYKQLSGMINVKAVQCKVSDARPTASETAKASADFLTLLNDRVKKENDVFLQSYAESLLIGGEDLSTKDVVVL